MQVKKMLAPEIAERVTAREVLDSPLFARQQRQPAPPQQTLGLAR